MTGYEDGVEGYIKSKTVALQASQKSARLKAAAAILWVALFWVFQMVSFGEAAACTAIALGWCSIYRAVCNAHIDQLESRAHDHDRDTALGLEGFHVPR